MNKGKNKGKIQKSRQNAEGREAGSFLGKAFDSYHKFLSNKVINFVINMILAIGTVLPFMMKMCNKVAFTYEVNDDAAIVQMLDGSYRNFGWTCDFYKISTIMDHSKVIRVKSKAALYGSGR